MPAESRAVWLVLPTYNEAENIEPLVDGGPRASCRRRARVLIVDDNSPDGTGEIADRLAAEHDDVEVLHRPRKEGLGPAYIAGFRAALDGGAELVIEMDADFSHDPAYLPRLLEAAERADLVLGSRYVAGRRGHRLGADAAADQPRRQRLRAAACSGSAVRDLTGGFKCFRREVLEAIDLDAVELARLRLPGRDDLPGDRARASGSSRCRSSSATAGSGTSKMSRAIVAEAIWRVPAAAASGRRPRRGRR